MGLSIREYLVWISRKPTFDTPYVSPAFDLLNSKWRLELTLSPETPEVIHPKFDISLRNCSETQSFSPFEVELYLEDRRTSVQHLLSSLTVYSIYEILCSTSFYYIQNRFLPGSLNYDEITAVCVFKPSTGLKLPLLENDSSFKIRPSLEWETEKPSEISEEYLSPVFALNNTIWRLCIKKDEMYGEELYHISIKKCCGTQSFQSFDVTTLIEDRRIDDKMKCSKLSIRSASETLCIVKLADINLYLPQLKYFKDIIIVCIFRSPTTELSLCVKKESVMRIAEAECSEFRNESNLMENVESASSNAYQSKRLLSLESLSENLGNLLDKSLMTDIQVKCRGDIIPAHKAILAGRSKVFSAMFQHETIESKSGIIDLKDVEPIVLRAFLRYFYTGEISANLSECEICELYELSDKYEVPVLQTLCSSYMTRMLKEENIIDFLKLADEYNDKDLKNGISEFMNENPLFLQNDIWISFSRNDPKLAVEIYQKHIAKTT